MVRTSPHASVAAGPWLEAPLPLGDGDREPAVRALLGRYRSVPGGESEGVPRFPGRGHGSGRHPPGGASELWLTWDMVRALHAAGMTIRGDTATHPLLPTLSPEGQREEIASCRRRIEAEVGAPMKVFAHPAGRFDAHTRACLAHEGVELAFAHSGGYARPRGKWDPYAYAYVGLPAGGPPAPGRHAHAAAALRALVNLRPDPRGPRASRHMELVDFLRLLLRRLWLVAALGLVVAGIALAQRARRPGLLRADAHLRDPAGQRDRRARDRRHPGRARLGRHGGGDGLRHAQLRALPRARGRRRRPRRRQGGRRGARGLDPAGQHGDRRLLRGPEPALLRGARQALYLRVHPLGLANVQDFTRSSPWEPSPRPPCPARAARSSRWVRASACCSASWPCSPRASCARAGAVPRPRSPAGRSSTRSRRRARTRWRRSGSRASCASTSTTTRPGSAPAPAGSWSS